MKTSWYRGDQKPVRAGVYERDYGNGAFDNRAFCWFDGSTWYLGSDMIEQCVLYATKKILTKKQNLPWRGLKDKP